MNTMYRNSESEYGTVKNEFNSHGSEIIMDSRNLQKELSDELNQMATKEESQVKKKMEDLKTDVNKEIAGSTLFSDIKNSSSAAYHDLLGKFDKMPKGGLLHVHSTVGLDADSLLQMIVEWNTAETSEQLKIFYLKEELEFTDKDGIKKKILEKALMFKKQFDSIPVEKDICEVSDENKTEIKNYILFNEKGNWPEFNNIFCRTKALFENKKFYMSYHEKFFKECIKNKIFYVEIRTGFQEFSVSDKNADDIEGIRKGIIFLRPDFAVEDFFYHENMLTDTNPAKPDIEFLKMIKLAGDSARETENKFEVKVILTANRNTKTDPKDFENVLKKMDAAIAIKNLYSSDIPEIVGFDFVSEEKTDIGTTDSFKAHIYSKFGCGYEMCDVSVENHKMIELLKEKERIQLIRFFLHDGESVDIIQNNSDNAITGPICSRHRIGHGFKMGKKDENFDETDAPVERKKGTLIADYILYGCSRDVGKIVNYPIILQESHFCREDKIIEPVIEFCPISNQLLGYSEDLKIHPAGNLVKKGIFAVVSNDDPQIFDNPGLSYDYLMAFINEILNYDQIKISVFLGYFYREMSNNYYIYIEQENIWMVNDNMTYEDEIRTKDTAIRKFEEDWNSFMRNF